MSDGTATKLYTPQILALATELSDLPLLANAKERAEAASRSCGSKVAVTLTTNSDSKVSDIGLLVTACAIGQASAVIFARSVKGLDLSEIRRAKNEIEQWLGAELVVSTWPGITALEQARHFPGRHEAVILPWRAAIAALSKH